MSSIYGSLWTGQRLYAGDDLTSNNHRFKLVMQAEGNLCLYTVRPWDFHWSSGTEYLGATYAEMQPDGNFVLYRDDGTAVWDFWKGPGFVKRYALYPGSFLTMQQDRNAVIRAPGGMALWDTGTALTPPDSGRERLQLTRGFDITSTTYSADLVYDGSGPHPAAKVTAVSLPSVKSGKLTHEGFPNAQFPLNTVDRTTHAFDGQPLFGRWLIEEATFYNLNVFAIPLDIDWVRG